jgi:hypothetical protein
LLHLADQRRQIVAHAIEPVCQRTEFVAPIQMQSLGKISLAHHIYDAHQ